MAQEQKRCPHCGALMMHVITNVKLLKADWVCSAGWTAPYVPESMAYACGALRAPLVLEGWAA